MRKITFPLLLVVLARCAGTYGPIANFRRPAEPQPVVPDPTSPTGTRTLTDEEQQVQVRERYSYLYEDNRQYAPNSYVDRPGNTGR